MITVPLMKISMQVGRTQRRSLNREKAQFNALVISQVGRKSNDISEVEAFAKQKDCTLESADGVYLATCTVGVTRQTLGTGSKAFVMCDSLSDSSKHRLSELRKKVKPGREILERGNSFYTIVDGPSWVEAEANAVKLGGHLVTINDEEENKWLAENFDYIGKWIGLTDSAHEGVFKWASGASVDFTNWAADQPDNYHGIQHYAIFSGHWNYKGIKYGWDDLQDMKNDENVNQGIAEIPRNSASSDNHAQNCEG
ncbi:C-type lectin domain-containing protein [Prochlorococcus marinus]|nr:C-type lectin domain-containing protein [Prochlorococcus marinus]